MTLWLVHRPPDNSWKRRHHGMGDAETHRVDLDRLPAPTVAADGICGGRIGQSWIEADGGLVDCAVCVEWGGRCPGCEQEGARE